MKPMTTKREWLLNLPAARGNVADVFTVRRDGRGLLIGYELMHSGLGLSPEVALFLRDVLAEVFPGATTQRDAAEQAVIEAAIRWNAVGERTLDEAEAMHQRLEDAIDALSALRDEGKRDEQR
jgi:hypothetical protein